MDRRIQAVRLLSLFVDPGSRIYPEIYFSYLTEVLTNTPKSINAFKIWDIVSEASYPQESIPFFSQLILTSPFPVPEKELTFFNKISIDQLIFPDIFADLNDESKLRLRSWRNRQQLLLAFSKANGMEDRKKFWPNYSQTVLNVYFSPYPNNVVLMEFPHHFVIEFVEVGNACFFYPKDLEAFNNVYWIPKFKNAIDVLIAACVKFPKYDEESLAARGHFLQTSKISAEIFKRAQNLKLNHVPNSWFETFRDKLWKIGNYSEDKK